MAAIDDRNKRLDDLAAAVTSWADKRTTELQNEVATAKQILKGRTGAERLSTATSTAAQSALVASINDFLLGT